jgi:hypothetical protein
MCIGTAARLWERLEPDAGQYARFLDVLRRSAARSRNTAMELYYEPFSMEDGLHGCLEEPPATLLRGAIADESTHAVANAWRPIVEIFAS